MAQATREGGLPKVSLGDVLAIDTEITLPTLSKGVIHRRQTMMSVAERLGFDARALVACNA